MVENPYIGFTQWEVDQLKASGVRTSFWGVTKWSNTYMYLYIHMNIVYVFTLITTQTKL